MALAIAVPLISLAVPRVVADLASRRGSDVLTRLQNQEAISAGDLDTFMRATERARAWVDSGSYAAHLGMAQLLAADRLATTDPGARAALTAAVAVLRDGLTKAPGDPYAWVRLAYAEARLNGWTPQAVSALRLALVTATHEPRLLWSRLHLSLLAWPHMSAADREIILHQVRLGWRESPDKLVRLATDLKQQAVVRDALARNRDDLRRFDAMAAGKTS